MSWIRDGAVALTSGSKAVSGTGTTWLGNVMEGDQFNTPVGPYEVESVSANGALQLVTAYGGPTASGLAYSIVPTQGRMLPVSRLLNQVLSTYGQLKDDWETIEAAEGSVQTALDSRPTLLSLLAANGGAKVGYQAAGTSSIKRDVKRKIDIELKSFLDKLTDAEIADCLLPLPTIDLSAKIQAFIDENKGGAVIFPDGYRYLHASVKMDGPTYNGTTVLAYGTMVLRGRVGGEGSTPFPTYLGLIIRDCEDVFLWYRGDGNRTNQTDEEHNYLVAFSGVRNLKCPVFRAREVRGDALYITQKEFGADSARSTGVFIDLFDVENVNDDGRNALTIISVNGLVINSFRSVRVGAVVGGIREPGGFCIEPNTSFQDVKNITVGTMHIEAAGGTCMQIAGTATNYAENINIGTIAVINTTMPNTASPVTGVLIANQYRVANILRARNVNIGVFNGRFSNAYGDGMVCAELDNVQLPLVKLAHVRLGAVVGQTAGFVKNSGFNFIVSECIQGAVQTGNVQDSKIVGRVLPVVSGYYASKFAVWSMRSGGVQTNVEYGVDVDYSPDWTRAYRNDISFPVTFTDCSQRNCSLKGPWSSMVGGADMPLSRFNVAGLSNRPTMPNGGSYIKGDRVTNDAPAVGAAKGWIRLTTGAAHALGVDWVSEGVL